MNESEKAEASHWLDQLLNIYEKNWFAISDISKLQTDSTASDWDEAFSNENVSALMNTIEAIKKLPKPESQALRKIKSEYVDLVEACMKAGNLYLKAYYAGELKRFGYSKMIFWTTFSDGIFKSLLKNIDKVSLEIGINPSG